MTAQVNKDLTRAVRSGDLEWATLLIDRHGLNYSPESYGGYRILRIAARKNHTDIVKLLLSRGCQLAVRGSLVDSPLHLAVRNGNVEMVDLLVQKGSDVNYKNLKGETSLALAVDKLCEPIVKLLLEHDADVNVGDEFGRTPLHYTTHSKEEPENAVSLEDMDFHETCGYNGGLRFDQYDESNDDNDVQHDDDDHDDSSVESVDDFDEFRVKEKIVELNFEDLDSIFGVEDDFDPHPEQQYYDEFDDVCNDTEDYAGTRIVDDDDFDFDEEVDNPKNLEIAILLLDRGANVNAQAKNGTTVLQAAVKEGFHTLVKCFLWRKANINVADNEGRTALHISVETGNWPITSTLLSNFADIDATTKAGLTALHFAVALGHKEIVGLLLGWGASVDCIDVSGHTPLHLIAHSNVSNIERNNCKEICSMLLARGAFLEAKRGDGKTVLHLAITQGLKNVVEVLLGSGAVVNCVDKYAQTPLHLVLLNPSLSSDLKLVGDILDRGADVNAKRPYGDSALHFAICNGQDEVVKLLLDSGAQANGKTRFGRAPLHQAAHDDNLKIMNALLTSGVDIHSRDDWNKDTALHISSKNADAGGVTLLVEHGADINSLNRSSFTPLDTAYFEHRSSGLDGYFFNDIRNADLLNLVANTPTLDFLIKHQFKMEAAGLDITEPLEPVRRLKEALRSNFIYGPELERMKSEYVNGINVSYYEILRKETRQLAKYMKNESVVLVFELEEYKNKFPSYAILIKSQFRKGLATIKLLEAAGQVLNRLSALPDDCIEKILEFLTDDDLRVLIDV